MIEEKYDIILLVIISMDSQMSLMQHGSKSGPFNLARVWNLICEIHIKHALLVTLSRP